MVKQRGSRYRKRPRPHTVRGHTRKGHRVNSYPRGSGSTSSSRQVLIKKMKDKLAYARKRDAEKRLEPLRTEKYSKLRLYEEKDPEKLSKGFKYKYIISEGALSHTAFRTEKGLNRFLKDTGLKLGKHYKHLLNSRDLVGSYSKVSMSGTGKKLNAFAKKGKLEPTLVLSNGEYTRGFIARKRTGNTIYYMNPNYPRKLFPYRRE